jgi:hypothetical protein
MGQACHASIGAQLMVARGEPERALLGARRAREAFAAMDNFSKHWLELLIAQLEGQGAAARVRDEKCAFLARQGWREPARGIETWLPVLRIL